ncbi:MAG TPA: hypothetical protein PL020_08205 [Candidatus Cloacimonadota bacterium]|nr:hypothetical protein [Candidatus Cloacimonadota bacterium]
MIYIVWIFFLCYLNISVVNLFSLLIGTCGLEFRDHALDPIYCPHDAVTLWSQK